jgi:hypothetical protein
MRKLLLTTALIGSTLVAGNAIAQTTVSGNLNISYKAGAADAAAGTTTNSGRGFGNEQQINIQNKGALNNGMSYAAGFSIENDGSQATTLFNENTFIDFIAGNTTFTIGVDHIQNIDRTTSTLLNGMEAGDMADGVNGTAVFLTAPGSKPAESYHAGVTQTIPGIGKVSFLYAPSDTTGGAATGSDKNFVEDNSESAMEIGFVGDLGVKGLNAHAFANKQKATSGSKAVTATAVNDHKGYNWGASYNMGSVTLGYDYKKEGAVAINADTKQNSFGAAYAVDKNLTVGLNYTKADKEGTTVDAKAKTLLVGYSLGPVALIANVSQLENITGTAGVDANVVYLAARTSF